MPLPTDQATIINNIRQSGKWLLEFYEELSDKSARQLLPGCGFSAADLLAY